MGMDLFALNDGVEPYHVNWSGWSTLGDLLQELGCDVSLMAGSNDGDVVPAEVALSWAEAIESNLGRIRVVVYPDASFVGNERIEFRVEGSLTPVILSSSEMARAFVAQALGREVAEPAGDLDVPPVQFNLSDRPEEEEWVVGFAQFCRSSGGFEQF